MNFTEQLNEVGIVLNDTQRSQFDKYFEILVEWNGFMNLTGITEYEEVLVKHFLDSLAVGKYSEKFAENPELSIIDVGTGAGFPGLPLKIAYPQAKVVLLDSLNKRVKFLDEVITQLGLTGITAVHARAEEGARNAAYREQFDISVSRAVANLSTLVEYCLPFVKAGGYFIAYKSGDIDAEAEGAKRAVSLLGGRIESVEKMTLPGTDIERSFVFVKRRSRHRRNIREKQDCPQKSRWGKRTEKNVQL